MTTFYKSERRIFVAIILAITLNFTNFYYVESAVFWDLQSANITGYEEESLVYTLQGLVNKINEPPELFYNTGEKNIDFPQSDGLWVDYFKKYRNITFDKDPPKPILCDLITKYKNKLDGAVLYNSDGFSIYLAMTIAGLDNLLPISLNLIKSHDCLNELKVVQKVENFADKFDAYRWAITNLLPRTNSNLVFNADYYHNAVQSQGAATIMSVDYPIQNKAFIMNLCPLWKCDPIDCGKGGGRVPTPKETALYVEILESKPELVSVWGWSDPEHAYTNITAHAGGVVFCTFSTPNLSFWRAISIYLNTKPINPPKHDLNRKLDHDKVYIMFETNEGDTPRILSSQFTGAWVSNHRGKIPMGWAADPYLGTIFPELWNFYSKNTTVNDTFIDGVDGAGYIFLHSLGNHAKSYETRAGKVLQESGITVVDVGVASNKWPAATQSEIEEYVKNAHEGNGGDHTSPGMILNACGTAWNQSINFWLGDGTPVINSVCVGPKNDTSNGHYLYYYRNYLNQTEPKKDLASRISWASNHYKKPSEPLFLLIFGSLGVYGGNSDVFTFLSDVIDSLDENKYEVVGSWEMSRLARELYYQKNNKSAGPTDFIKNIENAIDDIGEELYLGSGCYWGRQYDYVQIELSSFGRKNSQVTTIGGYMYGNSTNKNACYYNKNDVSVYSEEGHAEVVKINVPKLKIADILKKYFESFVQIDTKIWEREDYFDLGPGYRALIGMKGGMKNNFVMNLIKQVDPHNTTFKIGKGSDSDTLGKNTVYIYDSDKFEFHQAELCLQFHNNQTGTYPKQYHDIKTILTSDGKLKKTNCPLPEIVGCK